jgi:hypothetical protein
MSRATPVAVLCGFALLACACSSSDDTSGGNPSGDSQDSTDHTGDSQDSDSGQVACVDDASGTFPEAVQWIVLDGVSSKLFSFADNPFDPKWAGMYGTYNLNAEEVWGANGFLLGAPATIYGAQARWANLGDGEQDVAATLYALPDFSSDGFAFDTWNPYGAFTRCLKSADEGEWVDYVFPEPFTVDQPLYVYAGYHRDQLEVDGDDNAVHTAPELLMENSYNKDEPYFSGIKWPNVDDRTYYDGMLSTWYTWQVRLAVIYHDDIPAESKPFQVDMSLAASSRVAWGDYDNDGDDDMMTTGAALYQNDGDGTFTNVTYTAIPAGVINSPGGGVWGDYDNDGCLDYFGQGGSNSAGETLLHNNCDGTFTDVIDASGITDLQTSIDCNFDKLPEYSPTEGAGWFDYDGDGFIDLYLANYECWISATEALYYQDRLFQNNGDGTFTDVSDTAVAGGVDASLRAGRGVTTGDVDIDGDTDLYVSNYRLNPNFFYLNNGDGTLSEIGAKNGTRGDPHGVGPDASFGHTIGSVFGDIDNDGDFDLVTANLAHPFYYHFSNKTMVLVNDGSGNFTNEAAERGIYYRETHSNPTLFDADNDGDLDLFITDVYAYRDSDFYENDGTGHFTLKNYESGLVVQNGWGSAVSDFDNDGDQDMLAYALFRNNNANGNHWLEVRPVGVGSNVSAIGAVVEVQTDAPTLHQLRMVSGGSGTSSQDSFTQHFGLGTATEVSTLTVRFPYGDVVTIENVDADQKLWVYSDGTYTTGFAP